MIFTKSPSTSTKRDLVLELSVNFGAGASDNVTTTFENYGYGPYASLVTDIGTFITLAGGLGSRQRAWRQRIHHSRRGWRERDFFPAPTAAALFIVAAAVRLRATSLPSHDFH